MLDLDKIIKESNIDSEINDLIKSINESLEDPVEAEVVEQPVEEENQDGVTEENKDQDVTVDELIGDEDKIDNTEEITKTPTDVVNQAMSVNTDEDLMEKENLDNTAVPDPETKEGQEYETETTPSDVAPVVAVEEPVVEPVAEVDTTKVVVGTPVGTESDDSLEEALDRFNSLFASLNLNEDEDKSEEDKDSDKEEKAEEDKESDDTEESKDNDNKEESEDKDSDKEEKAEEDKEELEESDSAIETLVKQDDLNPDDKFDIELDKVLDSINFDDNDDPSKTKVEVMDSKEINESDDSDDDKKEESEDKEDKDSDKEEKAEEDKESDDTEESKDDDKSEEDDDKKEDSENKDSDKEEKVEESKEELEESEQIVNDLLKKPEVKTDDEVELSFDEIFNSVVEKDGIEKINESEDSDDDDKSEEDDDKKEESEDKEDKDSDKDESDDTEESKDEDKSEEDDDKKEDSENKDSDKEELEESEEISNANDIENQEAIDDQNELEKTIDELDKTIDSTEKAITDNEIEKSEEHYEEIQDNEPFGEEITEYVEYNELIDLFTMKDGYFLSESVKFISPEEKRETLKSQLATLIAKEQSDALYEDMIRNLNNACLLNEKILSKYEKMASNKADEIISRNDPYSLNNLAFQQELKEMYEYFNNDQEFLNEGKIAEKIKGKFMKLAIKLLPEKFLNNILDKSKAKSLSLAKTDDEKKKITKMLDYSSLDKKGKRSLLISLINQAPENIVAQADAKVGKAVKTEIAKQKSKNKDNKNANKETKLEESVNPEILNEVAAAAAALGTATWAAIKGFVLGNVAILSAVAGVITATVISVTVASVVNKVRFAKTEEGNAYFKKKEEMAHKIKDLKKENKKEIKNAKKLANTVDKNMKNTWKYGRDNASASDQLAKDVINDRIRSKQDDDTRKANVEELKLEDLHR